jgi:hypothetical protein
LTFGLSGAGTDVVATVVSGGEVVVVSPPWSPRARMRPLKKVGIPMAKPLAADLRMNERRFLDELSGCYS